MTTTESILKKVRKIEIKSKGLSNDFFSGAYHTAFKGSGMTFSEVRAYSPGDDVRNIDWNVTARSRSPYVKVFHEEREQTVMLLLDISHSSFFGGLHNRKIEIIAEIAAVLAFSAQNNNDKVGVIFFSDKIEKYIPPKKGKSHTLRIIREILTITPSEHASTNIDQCLKQFIISTKKKTIAFLISDFVGVKEEKTINIASRKHDLIGLHIYDEYEKTLPNVGLIQLKDSETGHSYWVDTNDKTVNQKLGQSYTENFKHVQELFRKSNASFESLNVKDDYVKVLQKLFSNRKSKNL